MNPDSLRVHNAKMLKAMEDEFDPIARRKAADLFARMTFIELEAYVAAGFTREEAMELLCH